MATKMEQLETWLWEYLTDHGRTPSADVKQAAVKAGFSAGALQTAKNKLGIVIDIPDGGRHSWWLLPEQASEYEPAAAPDPSTVGEADGGTREATWMGSSDETSYIPDRDRAEVEELKRKLAEAEQQAAVPAVGPIPEPGTLSRPAPDLSKAPCFECGAGGGDKWTHMAYCSGRGE